MHRARLLATVGCLAILAAPASVATPVTAATGSAPASAAVPRPAACASTPATGHALPATLPPDPHIVELGLAQVWARTRGAGATVAVVDTGVDASAPQLAGAVLPGRVFGPRRGSLSGTAAVPGGTVAFGGTVDCDGHGTAVAGIVAGRATAGAGRVSGVAPAAHVYPVAVTGPITQAAPAVVAAAVRDAADHADVVNLSFAVADTPALRAAVAYAVGRGRVVVAPASTGDGSRAVAYPAAYPGVLAVAAVGADATVPPDAPRGRWIDVAAPGESLRTVARGGYTTVSGPDFAAAVVSGMAALVLADSRLPGAEVAARIESTAVSPASAAQAAAIGHGLVDPLAAVTGVPTAAAAPAPAVVRQLPVPRTTATDRQGVPGLAAGAVLCALAVLITAGASAVRAGRRRQRSAG